MPRLDTQDLALAIQGLEALRHQTIADFDHRIAKLRALMNGHATAATGKMEAAIALATGTPLERFATRGRAAQRAVSALGAGPHGKAAKAEQRARSARVRAVALEALRATPAGLATSEIATKAGAEIRTVSTCMLALQHSGAVRFDKNVKRWQLATPAATRKRKYTTAEKHANGERVRAAARDWLKKQPDGFTAAALALFVGTVGRGVKSALMPMERAGEIVYDRPRKVWRAPTPDDAAPAGKPKLGRKRKSR